MGYELTKDLETGNRMIDNEHRELFAIVNQLLNACNRGDAMELISPVAGFLKDHMNVHFMHEEELQEGSGYPDREEHKSFHERCRQDLEEVLAQVQDAGPTITDIINLNGILSLMIDHVRTDDKKMCEYLRRRL